ncbi:MAG: hypothetical protein KF744_02485 [Taibaiella sp.]|nr:hypothetical protein [Taibaiella sp.]
MPIITAADLGTNLYPEIIDEITRADGSMTDAAISVAENEAKMYLGRYDLEALFGTATAAPTFADAYLQSLVKDLACWHLLRVANPGADYQAFRTAYLDALNALKEIRNGAANPYAWPYAAALSDTPDGDAVSWTSNERRNNHY